MSSGLRIAILAFDGVEALDLAGPFEVFTTASRMARQAHPATLDGPAHWQTSCVARTLAPVKARAGLVLLPALDFAQCPSADLLIVPGGVVDSAVSCPATLDWIARVSTHARITASVCTGVFILAAAGVTTTGKVTTHWEDMDDLQRQYPGLTVDTQSRWVDQGQLVTSAGISAGIDMSLHLVERLAGPTLAKRTARQMDYPWQRD